MELGVASATIALDLNDGLESLIRQIVETALVLERGSSTKAAVRLGISARTVQRYVASGRVRPAHPAAPRGVDAPVKRATSASFAAPTHSGRSQMKGRASVQR